MKTITNYVIRDELGDEGGYYRDWFSNILIVETLEDSYKAIEYLKGGYFMRNSYELFATEWYCDEGWNNLMDINIHDFIKELEKALNKKIDSNLDLRNLDEEVDEENLILNYDEDDLFDIFYENNFDYFTSSWNKKQKSIMSELLMKYLTIELVSAVPVPFVSTINLNGFLQR